DEPAERPDEEDLAHVPAKACPGLDPGWSPVRRQGHAPTSSFMVAASSIRVIAPQAVATATLAVDTAGEGFVEITRDVARFVTEAGALKGALFLFIRHTSASLTIQENADPDVRTDLVAALRRLAPE